MTNPLKKADPFLLSGALFTVWAFLNTYLDILRYGIDQGFYWWFCNLALIGMALGLVFKHRGWITGFLSIACFTQIFWLIDNQYRVLTGKNLFGLVEFMYQPGLPIDEFLLSHYHYFTIPIAIIALVFLPQKKSNTLTLIAIFNPFIFGVSYFVFPPAQNVNCIHQPCFPGLVHWAGPLYSFLFWGIIFLVHLLIGYRLENVFTQTPFTDTFKKRALWVFWVFCGLSCLTAFFDTRYRLSLPRFTCSSQSQKNVSVECGFTLDDSPGKMSLNYRLINQTSDAQFCTSYLELDKNIIPMHFNALLLDKEKKRLKTVIPYPKSDVHVVLKADCQALTMPQ